MSDVFVKQVIRSQSERIEILEDKNANLQYKYDRVLNDLVKESHKRIELEKENEILKARQEIGKTCGLCPYYHYKSKCEKVIDSIDTTIKIIRQQSTEDDTWVLDRLNGFKYLLQGDDEE